MRRVVVVVMGKGGGGRRGGRWALTYHRHVLLRLRSYEVDQCKLPAPASESALIVSYRQTG